MTTSDAGRALVMEHDITQPMPAYPGKSCGACGRCCEIMPVKELHLVGWQRCPHLAGPPEAVSGCKIYDHRPLSCRLWSCSWLITDLPDELRPDRCGIVIDPLPDVVRVNGVESPAAQFWVARGYEHDWDKRIITALIKWTIEAGFVVLWRMAPDADGRKLAICFAHTDDGAVRSPPFEVTSDFGYDGERLMRVQALLKGRKRDG